MLPVNCAIFYSPKDKTVHADSDFSTQWCYGNFLQHRCPKRARDLHDQLARLMARVDIDLVSGAGDTVGIRKAASLSETWM
jgi:pre-mRNA-splicing factor ATP-dependent RNA helicase DHX16